ncbi:hypothetical protein ACHWQZ_G007779 [Mnemiopsis leidyi]
MTFYADRPEWKDVTPIPLPYSENEPVVQIMYSERFKDVYGYMAAIMQKKEYSERALNLTTDAIECNAANYTVWHYRREILRHLQSDLQDEMKFTESVIDDQPKNYQVWHHRRCIIEMTGDPSQELDLTEYTLSSDAKNYHAWDHRQWVLSQYKIWDKELEYIDDLLSKDLRNNSAWNHRYFVIENSQGWSRETISKELEYAGAYIKKAPNNESSWNFARGIIKKNKMNYSDFPAFKELCVGMNESHIPSPFLLSTLADINIEEGNKTAASNIFEQLKDLDSIREKYWTFKQDQLQVGS